MLCLIGKGADACRYLVSYGLWEDALWLAKATLPFEETLDIIKKCAIHFKNQGDWVSIKFLPLFGFWFFYFNI